MAENTSKTPGTFDPEALLAAQQRNVEAFTNAGKIVAEGMRTYAQSQVGMMQGAMRDLWGAIQTGGRAPAATGPSDQLARMRTAFDRVLAQIQEVSQLLLKVQSEAMAVLNDAAAANAQALGRRGSQFRRDAKDGHRGHAERIAPGHRRHRRDAPADDRSAGRGQAGNGRYLGKLGGPAD